MDTAIRTEVWDQMVEADRLSRYYGAVANKMGNCDRLAAIATTAFAVGSTFGFGLSYSRWFTGPMIFATLVASLWPLVYRSGGRLTDVVLSYKRICHLYTQFKSLWTDIESGTSSDDAARARLRDLTYQLSEVSGLTTGSIRYDENIRQQTEAETQEYWIAYKERDHVVPV